MTPITQTNKYLPLGLMLALLSAIILFAWTPAAQAERGPGRADRGPHPREFHDSRYHHDRDYPSRGVVIRTLPRDHRVIVHRGSRYYFSGGAWYRPYGPSFTVVVPPFGLFVPFLPPYYTTIWVHGIPYYYANEVYYAHQGSGYVIVEPPKEEVSPAPPPADQMFIYPRLGQNENQQADDRYACHRWAVGQTNFDPTQPPDTTPESRRVERRADYQRAMAACLDGRGYTVK
ncbi:MAG: hypothetical protein LLG97_16880 [Deltaproteobacteria bacterium]|nr:hypothetical protein [Deltaproteobacteria bacterium]